MDETLPPQNPFAWDTEPPAPLERRRGRDLASMPSHLGSYRIVEKIGEGGMGTVFKCRDEDLDRWVALKVLHRRYAVDAHYRSRFQREARTIARLSHPAIVQVYAILEGGDGDDPLFSIVMEYLEGESLDSLLARRGALPLEEALDVALTTARGLRAAHASGVIHRDVKPSNLLVTAEGGVRIVDFGLAKALRGDTSLTEEGIVLGTPHYISPEQGRGRTVDHRSDIYSLGATLYHMLCGRPPFEAESHVAVIVSHVNEEARPVHEVAPRISFAVSQVVARMMAKAPSDRYQTYDELVADIEALRRGEPPPSRVTTALVPRPGPGVRKRASSVLAPLAGGVIGVLLAIVVIIVAGHPRPDAIAAPLDQVHRDLGGGVSAVVIDFAKPPRAEPSRFLRPLAPDLAPARLEGDRLVWQNRDQALALAVPFAEIQQIRVEYGDTSGAVDLALAIFDPGGERRRVLRLTLRPAQELAELPLVARRHNWRIAARAVTPGEPPGAGTAVAAAARNDLLAAALPPVPRLGQVPFGVFWRFERIGGATRVHVRVARRLAAAERPTTVYEARCELDGTDWASGYVVMESISPLKTYSASIERVEVLGRLAGTRLAESLPWSPSPPPPSS